MLLTDTTVEDRILWLRLNYRSIATSFYEDIADALNDGLITVAESILLVRSLTDDVELMNFLEGKR